MLMKDVEGPGAPKEVSDTIRAWAWGAIAVTALAFEAMGQVYIHATDPYLWALFLFLLSIFATVTVVRLWAKGRTNRPAALPVGDAIFGDG